MSNCRITPVLVLVLVFSFMFGGCGRDMDLRELSQDQVPAGAGEVPGAGGSGGEDVSGEAECVIHICGAVAVPGVYRLPAGSRVVDAVKAAGGLAEDAAERGVNQAAPISDGMQIVIPTLEEAEQGIFSPDGVMEENGSGKDGLVDINTADAAELMTLPGIGQTRADAIVAYRQQNGKFQSIEDIMKVDGIKEGSFAKLKDRICVRQ
ncbi:helix-hairpin-helix domain-containing protein [Eisenbergiella massiliensis]|uniref:helix-hairpin-helix domain-containing protein n=1 Tax=Eisenbergiella massiliensis TaxID=1720294 RepID=UPI000C85491A|nr:helix-hairpin-helix domain-containing protein [Eisenbergiella massiliensis]